MDEHEARSKGEKDFRERLLPGEAGGTHHYWKHWVTIIHFFSHRLLTSSGGGRNGGGPKEDMGSKNTMQK